MIEPLFADADGHGSDWIEARSDQSREFIVNDQSERHRKRVTTAAVSAISMHELAEIHATAKIVFVPPQALERENGSIDYSLMLQAAAYFGAAFISFIGFFEALTAGSIVYQVPLFFMVVAAALLGATQLKKSRIKN